MIITGIEIAIAELIRSAVEEKIRDKVRQIIVKYPGYSDSVKWNSLIEWIGRGCPDEESAGNVV